MRSSHLQQHIPLPLISFDASMGIILKKGKLFEDLKGNKHFIQLVLDMGGHCRAVEYLYGSLYIRDNINDEYLYCNYIRNIVVSKIDEAYFEHDTSLQKHLPLESAIARSLLSIDTERSDVLIEG